MSGRSPREVAATVAVLALGIVAAVVLSEAAVRALGVDGFRLELVWWDAFGPSAQYDRRLGWANLPGTMGANRQGFRFPRDYQRARNRASRTAILGDSQVFGLGVGQGEHLGVLVDARLDAGEAYSFGVPGYGPTQELLLLEEVLEVYEVDRVVVVTFLENDLIDATLLLAYGSMQKPYFERSPDGWRVANSPVPMPFPPGAKEGPKRLFLSRTPRDRFVQPAPQLYDLSAVYRTVVGRSVSRPALARTLARAGLLEIVLVTPTNRRLWSIRRVDGRAVPCWLVTECPESHWLDGLEPAVAAYVEMARACRERGVDLSVLVAPTAIELERGEFPITDRFAQALRDQGIAQISLKDAFLAAGDPGAVIADHHHWTSLGTRLAADAVVRHVRAAPSRPGAPPAGS